ncbi:MAG TPA: MFS transporter [Caulobacteraceae bacterium]|jgi:MFS family permease|nr:MFS transporter [Caulobacteraceae bacterium]
MAGVAAEDHQSSTLRLMGSPAYRGWVLVLFLLMSMFGFVDRQVIGSLGQPIKASLHLTDAQFGIVGGLAFALLNSLLTIPIARLAERRRRLTIIGIGVFLWSIATCLCGLTASFVQLLVARVAVGVGDAASTPSTVSVIADYFPPNRRTSAAAVFILAVPLGALIGAAGGGYLAEYTDWRVAFVIAGAPGLVIALLLVLTVREPIRGHYDAPGLGAAGAPPISAVLRRMIQRPTFLHVTMGSTLASMGGFGINLFLAQYFFRRFGLGLGESGLLSGLISAIPGSISMLGGGFLADRLGRKDKRFYAWTPGLGALLATPLYALSFLQGSWAAATALLMVTALCQYAYLPVSIGVTANLMEPRMRATAAAVVGIMTNLIGAGLAPIIVGKLSDSFTSHVAARCAGAAAAAPSCTAASGEGLRLAFIVFALVYLWAAAHFALAGRTIRKDMA